MVQSAPVGTLSPETLPENIVNCEYAVRGQVVIRADEINAQLAKGECDKLYSKIVPCNIGNPQAVGQSPIKFHRQVLACLLDPALLEHEELYPEDVRARAKHYLNHITDARMGAYSHSKGHLVFRKDVARFLTERDGAETDPEDIFLTDGASGAVKMVLQMAVRNKNDGVLIPIPQYPLYSASMTLLGGETVGYYLDEARGWSANVAELRRAVEDFRAKGGCPRAIAVINPGNPTGQVLSRETIAQILEFAEEERLLVMADEVYQDNIHTDEKEFVSFRSVALETGSTVEVFSFHSISKGVTGECGIRGGFVHCMNVHPGVMEQMYKLSSISLCSNTVGQALMASIVTPPPADGPSRKMFDEQRNGIRSAMKRKAQMVTQRLNEIEGISCQPIEGAMYAFPCVDIKGNIAETAAVKGVSADLTYCLEMLEQIGVVAVPGSGFGQEKGTFHFRMTVLPDEETLSRVLDNIAKFQAEHAR